MVVSAALTLPENVLKVKYTLSNRVIDLQNAQFSFQIYPSREADLIRTDLPGIPIAEVYNLHCAVYTRLQFCTVERWHPGSNENHS